jgi:hypothetical protein
VSLEFGILGLYLLAEADVKPSSGHALKAGELPEEVVYIGMSRHIDRRLEKTHHAVTRYTKSENAELSRLWFATWQSEWTNFGLKRKGGLVGLATLALYERALILLYAKKYGRLPKLNRM